MQAASSLRRIATVKTLFGVVLLAFQCSRAFAGAGADTLVWPQPPDRPRIRHVMTLTSGLDFHEEGGLLSTIFRFLGGSEQASAWLVQPVGIAVSDSGILYVADPGVKGVHRIDLRRREHRLAGETVSGTFRSPVGIVCGPDGKVYIADADAGCVDVADEELEPESVIREHLVRPTGLTILHRRLYVADAGAHRIVMFDLGGTYLGAFGRRGTGQGEFNFPVQLASKESLYVVDALNYRIQAFDDSGRFAWQFGQQGTAPGRFASPKAVALDADGDLYVSDALMDNLQIFAPQGRLLLSLGERGVRDGEFMMPNGIAIDAQNRIYVVETLNRRIQVFQYLK